MHKEYQKDAFHEVEFYEILFEAYTTLRSFRVGRGIDSQENCLRQEGCMLPGTPDTDGTKPFQTLKNVITFFELCKIHNYLIR